MTPNVSAPGAAGIVIRAMSSPDDFIAGVALQYDAWGASLTDVTPATIFKIVQRIGGVSAGAFAPDGTMLGFVFGITGVERGAIVHWSHMLAVRSDVQNSGIGRQLKEFQRSEVARLGAHVIYWTYDPLVARNAHLNFNVMGVRAVEYVRDIYPTMDRGLGTDRFIVAWPVDDAELAARRRATEIARRDSAFLRAPVLNPDPLGDLVTDLAPKIRVQIPTDIARVQATDLALAARWRSCTRAAFERALAEGYEVQGFRSDADRGYYLLAH